MTYRIRLAAAAAAVTVLLLPGAGQAFEEEAEVIEDAMNHTVLQGVQRRIVHQTRLAVTRGGAFFSSGEHASFAVFAGADANYVTLIDGWEILGSLGLTFSHVTADEYANAANPATDLGIFGGKSSANTRLSLGGQASYPVNIVAGQHGIGAMPYARAAVEYDIEEVPRGGTAPLTNTPSEEDDPFGLRLAFGADVDIADAAIMSLEFGSVLARDDYTELSLNANVRLPF